MAGSHAGRVTFVDADTGRPATVDSSGRLIVQINSGQTAHDSAVTGASVRAGARAVTANFTAVGTGNQTDLIATTVGAQIVRPYSIPELDWSYAAANLGIVNTTTAVTIKAAAGAGIRNYITWMDVTAEAPGTATELAVRDGAAGTVLWRTKIGTGGITAGRTINFPSPLRGSANTLLEIVTLTASTTGAVYINAGGYSAP